MNNSKIAKLLNIHFKKRGFSLMEVMILLLVAAVVAAASAPMITSRLGLGIGDNNGKLWQRNGDGDAYFVGGMNRKAIVGTNRYKRRSFAPMHPSLVNAFNSIVFQNNNNYKGAFSINDNDNGYIGISNYVSILGKNSIAVGKEQTLKNEIKNSVSVGNGVNNDGDSSVVIGQGAHSLQGNSVAIGRDAFSKYDGDVVIGFRANRNSNESGVVVIGANSFINNSENNDNSVAIKGSINGATNSIAILGRVFSPITNAIAIGNGAVATAPNSIAIGYGANAIGNNSIAIGSGVIANNANDIMIGNSGDSVQIGLYEINVNDKSQLRIGLNGKENTKVRLCDFLSIGDGQLTGNRKVLNFKNNNKISVVAILVVDDGFVVDGDLTVKEKLNVGLDNDVKSEINNIKAQLDPISDRRLKNVGDKYIAGLDEIKKLKLYNYTYKNDLEKIPHVGVIAQDLQKIFPNAVTKGKDGYLRIRMEDMFYALVNAVRELDNKVIEISSQVKDLKKEIANLKSSYNKQQKILDKRQIALAERSKKLEDLSNKVDVLSQQKIVKTKVKNDKQEVVKPVEQKIEKQINESKENVQKEVKVKEKKVKKNKVVKDEA